jgi:hypothetical protein
MRDNDTRAACTPPRNKRRRSASAQTMRRKRRIGLCRLNIAPFMSNGRRRPSTSIRRSPPADPGHEPRGGPEFESLHSGWDRPRLRDFSCATDASVDGRNAQIPVIPKRRGEWVNSTEVRGRDVHCYPFQAVFKQGYARSRERQSPCSGPITGVTPGRAGNSNCPPRRS